MRSLQARMMAVLCSCIFLVWLLAAALLIGSAGKAHKSAWDGKLQAIAIRLLTSIPVAPVDKAVKSGPTLQVRDEADAGTHGLVFQVWIDRSRVMVETPGAPATALQPAFTQGFSTQEAEGRTWRVYAVEDSTGRVQVQAAVPASTISAEKRRSVLQSLAFATVLMLVIGLVMWWAVRHSLASVGHLETALRTRSRLDLTPLPTTSLPTEVRPLVESFNAQLARVAQAMAAERRFIDDAAHELRTPLAALQAHAQNALAEPDPQEKDRKLVKLLASAHRSTRLSEQLLDLALLDGGRNRPRAARADLYTLAEHVVREFEVLAQRDGKSIRLLGETASIACDIDEIGILFRNLVDNALRHAASEGQVEVRCGTVGGRAWAEVADDGAGVPQGEHEAIFQRFHRIGGSGTGGSGIGLSLVAGIAALHGAAIETGTGIGGRGFRVRVLFPAAHPVADPETADDPLRATPVVLSSA
ncbi:MAG TPA: ATP-binding protein [Ramlibacter sp.]|nr:ATP-binding protein [Ramlibacter sp.]